MKPRSGSRLLRDPLDEHRFRLPLEPRSRSVWTFSTDKKYHAAKALSVGYDVPVACDCTGSFAAGPEKVEWDFSQERGRKTIPLTLPPDSGGGVLSVACTNYSADPVSIIIENPSLLALGIRETPDALLPDYPLLVDGKAVDLPLDSRDLVEGTWALSGGIALSEGPHTVTMIENPYVKAISLMIEAPSPDHMSHKKEEVQGAGQPALKGLLSKLAKVILIAVLALVMYRKRAVLTSVLHRPYRVRREMYLFVPEDGLLLLWLAAGGGEAVYAEVPLQYYAGNALVDGIIDRLLLSANTAHIIDYKTHSIDASQAEATAQAYREQLHLYAEGVRKLWPERRVRASILFTHCRILVDVIV